MTSHELTENAVRRLVEVGVRHRLTPACVRELGGVLTEMLGDVIAVLQRLEEGGSS